MCQPVNVRILFSFALLSAAYAASTTTWELNTFQDFVKGKFGGVALTRDGRLERAPAMKLLFDPEEAAIWSVAATPEGRIYLGTGPRGKLFEVDAAGQGKLLWTAPQPMIFAVTADAKGVVYAATSPDGRVYRIENGRATEYFNPQAKYIWALAVAADGRLFVAAGDQGKVFVVSAPGRGEVYYDTGQTHVTALAIDAQGRLLAGSEPNGILYRITAKDKAFVLYDAALPEIRSILVSADGSLYVAALGGSLSKKTAAAAANPAAPMVSSAPISITVTDEAQAGLDLKPKDTKPAAGGATPAVTSALVPAVEYAGVEKSAIYRIRPDNTVETLWTSKEENAYDLLEQEGALLFATDLQGRIYKRAADNQLSLIAQTEQGETTRLFHIKGGLLAATANRGQLFRLTPSEKGGQYESPVHDAGTVARWGRLAITGGGTNKFETRSGNTARPDRTWSDWEAVAGESKLSSPAARYVQWRAAVVDAVDAVRLAYLPQNTPPTMKSITVVGQTVASQGAAKPVAAAPAATAAYTLTVTDTGETAPAASAGTPTQNVVRSSTRQLVIVWQGEDPDGDPLQYNLSYRGEGERNWKMLKSNTGELALTVDADVFADGRYWFRVVASDKLANTAESAREAELVSGPVVVDNTPPLLTDLKAASRGEYSFTAQDNLSELRRAEYSLDAGGWILLEAEDGVTDSLTERFKLSLPALPVGEHTLTFRVFDGAGNSSARKLLVE